MQEHMHEWWDIPTRAVCWHFDWWLLGPYVFGNLLVASAYMALPYFAWKIARGRKGKWLTKDVYLWAAFILLCGGGHMLAVLLVWFRLYPVAVVWDVGTGLVSWWAALRLRRLISEIVAAPDVRAAVNLKDFWERRNRDLHAHPLTTRQTDAEVEGRIHETIAFIDAAMARAAAMRLGG